MIKLAGHPNRWKFAVEIDNTRGLNKKNLHILPSRFTCPLRRVFKSLRFRFHRKRIDRFASTVPFWCVFDSMGMSMWSTWHDYFHFDVVFNRFRSSTLIRFVCHFVLIHCFQQCFQIDAFSVETLSVLVSTEGQNASKCTRFQTKTRLCGRGLSLITSHLSTCNGKFIGPTWVKKQLIQSQAPTSSGSPLSSLGSWTSISNSLVISETTVIFFLALLRTNAASNITTRTAPRHGRTMTSIGVSDSAMWGKIRVKSNEALCNYTHLEEQSKICSTHFIYCFHQTHTKSGIPAARKGGERFWKHGPPRCV